MTKNNLQDQVVIITGASQGIGRATALAFAEAGARAVLAARNESALQEVAQIIQAQGGEALVVPTDVSDQAQSQPGRVGSMNHCFILIGV
jgi:NAD(P)-dependent dehydrogenase (short-subunit alcohol dehydrogenase family)